MRLNYEYSVEFKHISEEINLVNEKSKLPCKSSDKERCYMCGGCRKLYRYGMCKKCYTCLNTVDVGEINE